MWFFYNFTLFLKSGFCSRNSIILNILLTKKATFLARKFISVIWQVFIKIEYLDKVILLPQSVELMKRFAVYIKLIAICGHILQKVLYNRTFMRVEYILYLPSSSSLHKVRPKRSIIGFNLQIMVLENGPKFHKNGQMAFINTFPIFFLFLDFFNMFNCSTSTLDQNETFLRVNSSAMLMEDQVTLKIIWILWKIKFHGICAKCKLQWKIIFHKFYGQ